MERFEDFFPVENAVSLLSALFVVNIKILLVSIGIGVGGMDSKVRLFMQALELVVG